MKKFISEFKAFALRGNVMDLAVGVIIGGAFTALVTSLINNLINPIIGCFSLEGFSGLSVTIGKKQAEEEESAPEEPPKPTTEELLAEILEEIKNK